MADIPIEFKIKAAAVEAALRDIASEEAKRKALGSIGRSILTKVQLGFRTSQSPWGLPWKPITHRKGKPLVDTGRLRSSMSYAVKGDTVQIGTNVVYGRFQHFGGNFKRTSKRGNPYVLTITPRPFLPVNPAGQADLPGPWALSALNAIAKALKIS